MSGGVHLRGLAPGQYSSEETSQRWRTVRNTAFNLTDLGSEPQTSRAVSDVLSHHATRQPVMYIV